MLARELKVDICCVGNDCIDAASFGHVIIPAKVRRDEQEVRKCAMLTGRIVMVASWVLMLGLRNPLFTRTSPDVNDPGGQARSRQWLEIQDQVISAKTEYLRQICHNLPAYSLASFRESIS